MIRIGIVGDIGSGKSYVAKKFNLPVFDADFEVSKIYKKSRKCFNKLKKIFPKNIFSFPIKRKELSSLVAEDKNNVKKTTNLLLIKLESFLIEDRKEILIIRTT